jgi:hypothetical protein
MSSPPDPDPDRKGVTTVVIGDVHSRLPKLVTLCERIGLVRDGVRQPGFHVIQLGDLVSLGYHQAELEFLETTRGWIDVQLVGNHELPALFWDPLRCRFGGWDERDRAAEEWIRREGADWSVATTVGEWLVTHAGVSAHHWHAFGTPATAAGLADALNERWRESNARRLEGELFAGAGRIRGGRRAHPGIMWLDIEELLPDYDDDAPEFPLRQIVGHSPHGGPTRWNDRLWCIDTPSNQPVDWGGVAALTTTEGVEFELHSVP